MPFRRSAAVGVVCVTAGLLLWCEVRPGRDRSPETLSWSPSPSAIDGLYEQYGRELEDLAARQLSVQPVDLIGLLHRWRVLAVLGREAELRREMEQLFDQRGRSDGSHALYFRNRDGWQVRRSGPREDKGAASPGEFHVDQLLATCAETGVPLTQQIMTDDGTLTVEELVEGSRAFHIRDEEPYWSIIAYCCYRPAEPEWTNRFGVKYSYEELGADIAARPADDGPCGGSHRCYALAYLLRLDEHRQVLRPAVRREIYKQLRRASETLALTQRADGGWDSQCWVTPTTLGAPVAFVDPTRAILVTGHHLEWMAIASPDARPNDAVIERAVRFILSSCRALDGQQMVKDYCAFSHGLRAIGLLCGSTEVARRWTAPGGTSKSFGLSL